jgi:hypothetical protein
MWQWGHSFTVGFAALCWERRLFVRECDCFCLGTAIGPGMLAKPCSGAGYSLAGWCASSWRMRARSSEKRSAS